MGRLRDQVLRIGARELEDCACARPRLRPTRGAGRSHAARHADRRRRGSARPGRRRRHRRRATMYRIAAPAREKTGDGVALCCGGARAARHGDAPVPPDRPRRRHSRSPARCSRRVCAARARLYNAHGERFMARYDPVGSSARPATSSHARYTEIVEGGGRPQGGVLLDITHLGADEVDRRFGQIGTYAADRLRPRHRARGGLADSPLPHGRRHDRPDCRTSVAGLLVAGEDAGAPTARTGSAETASPSRPCSARGPGIRPRRSCRRGASTCPIRSWSPRRSSARTRR